MRITLTPLRFLERAASVHPDRTAIIDGPRSFTYREMTATRHPSRARIQDQRSAAR